MRNLEPVTTSGKKLYGLDVETECNVDDCNDKECRHALDFNRLKVTQIAVTDGLFDEHVFQKKEQLLEWLEANPDAVFTMQNGKFDCKALNLQAVIDRWALDSAILAYVYTDKISEKWLSTYEEQRRERNKDRKGIKHREAGLHSLKTLAPFFLGKQAFWEPEDHNDSEYALLDARYCLELTNFFLERMSDIQIKFATGYSMKVARLLMYAELQGLTIDVEECERQLVKSAEAAFYAQQQINEAWAPQRAAYRQRQVDELKVKYNEQRSRAKTAKQLERINKLEASAIAKLPEFNIGSPAQLKWLLKEQLGLDITNFKGKDSTDKEMLQKLANSDLGVSKLVEYREHQKLISSFYPEYLRYAFKGKIHATFNVTNTRTGRLSGSDPNLQQCPKALHSIFTAQEGHLLITKDAAAIEPTILAFYSEDPVLCQLLINKEDFHGTTALAAFNLECSSREVKQLYPSLRDIAKTIGLAVLYGAGANQVLQVLHRNGLVEATLQDAKTIVNRIRELYRGVWEFKRALDAELTTGGVIYSLLGRPIKIADPDDVYMKGLNRLIQGSASDHIADCAVSIYEQTDATPLALVHDEIVSEVRDDLASKAEQQIDAIMTARQLPTKYGNIPLRIEGKVSHKWEK